MTDSVDASLLTEIEVRRWEGTRFGEMYQAIHHALEKHEDLHGSLEGANLPVDACLVLTTDPKPRLRWTAELHERFVDAVTQLGGPDKATPKTIMRAMGVKGLTLYHLKSHLQKYRLGKQACKELTDGSQNATSLLEDQGNPSSMVTSKEMNDGYQVTEALRVQMEVQRRLHEQLEVQRHLELRIEAQGKYLQSILEKACRVLADQDMASTGLEAARQELSDLTIKVSTNNSARDTATLASVSDMPSIYPGERSANRQTQMTDCSVDSCLTSNDSCGLFSGEKKRTRPTIYCDGESLVWESDIGRDVQWATSI